MQKTSFPVEVLIHDDASTDGTDDLVREYAEKYPGIFFPLFEKENQYSKPHHKHMDLFNYERARGKYIAYCEGDDYWTDPLKLQKQVDFLESHDEYSVCWHRCRHLYWDDKRWENDSCDKVLRGNALGADVDISTFFSGWYTQPLTMVFRRSLFDFEWNNQYKYFRDEHESFHLLSVGKGYLFGFFGGVYVIHGGGVFGAINIQKQSRISCNIAEELYIKNKSKYTKEFYSRSLQWAVYQHTDVLPKKIVYSWKLFMLDGNLKNFIKNLLR